VARFAMMGAAGLTAIKSRIWMDGVDTAILWRSACEPAPQETGLCVPVRSIPGLDYRMFPLAEEAMKTLANFRATVMAGLDPAI